MDTPEKVEAVTTTIHLDTLIKNQPIEIKKLKEKPKKTQDQTFFKTLNTLPVPNMFQISQTIHPSATNGFKNSGVNAPYAS